MPRGELQVHVAKDNGILRDVKLKKKVSRGIASAAMIIITMMIKNMWVITIIKFYP